MEKDVKNLDIERFNPRRAVIQMAIARFLVGPFHKIYNRLKVEGRNNIPDDGPFMIVSNHLSYFDPPIVVVSFNRPAGFIAKKELYNNPWFTTLIKFLGAIKIDRDKPSLSTIRAVKKVLQAGWSVGIFIEGTRNRTPGILGTPHLGPAYLAWSNKVRILPVGLLNTNNRKSGALVRFGKVIEPSEDLEATTWKIMASISELTGWTLPNRSNPLDVPKLDN